MAISELRVLTDLVEQEVRDALQPVQPQEFGARDEQVRVLVGGQEISAQLNILSKVEGSRLQELV